MRRRTVGLGAINKSKLAQAKYKDKGYEIAADQLEQMSQQLESFKQNLEEFAANHKNDIRKNPQFRQQFQEMCASIGVDPLASSKGFWSEMLGVGDFYYELGVQIVEVCLATRRKNGGLMSLEELRDRLMASRSSALKAQHISLDDVLRAIGKLKNLGNGFSIIPIGNTYLVQSIPGELNMDHTMLLQQAQSRGYVTVTSLVELLNWEEERSRRALDHMLTEGLAWVDDQAEERQFWFPGLLPEVAAQA